MILKSKRFPELSESLRKLLSFIRPFLFIGVAWEISGKIDLINAEIFPTPWMILSRMWLLLDSGVLFMHLGGSLYRMLLGFFLAVSAGVTTGLLLATNQILKETFSPILSMLISVPTIAWVPVLLVTLGLGDATVITAVFLGGYFAITYNTMRGIEMIDLDVIFAAQVMGAKNLKLVRQVLIPASMVSIIPGLRLGIGYSWRALVGGEMLSALVQWGIGKMIYQARFWNDISAMLVGLLIIGVTGVFLDRQLLKKLEQATVEKWGQLSIR